MIGTFFVPITALELASEANSIREVSTQYVNYLIEFLKASLENDRDVPFPPASGLVYGPVTSIEELEQGKVKIEIFNGNHSLLACKSLVDEFPSVKCLQTRQVTIYRDLTEEEIQTLALIGNEESSNSKPTSDFDKIRIMRKKFLGKFKGSYNKEYLEYIYQIFTAVCQNKKEETKKKKSVGLLAKLGAMDGNCYEVFLQLQQKFPDHGSYIYESMFKLSKNSALYLLNEIKDERIKFQDIKSSTKKMPECEENELPFVPRIRAKKSAKTIPVEGKDTSKKSVEISSEKGKLPRKEISIGQSSKEAFASQQTTRRADNDLEVSELKKQNKELKDQLGKTTEEINFLKGEMIQLMTIRTRNQELEDELDTLKNDSKKENDRIKEIESMNKELTHQIQQNKEEMKILKEECLQLDMFKTRNKELESEIKKLKSDIDGLNEVGAKNKEAFEPALKRKRIHEKNTDTKDMTEDNYPFSFEETNKKYGNDNVNKKYGNDNSTDDTTETDMEIMAIDWNKKVYLCQKMDKDIVKFCKKPFGFIDKYNNFIPTNNVGWNILNNKDIQSLNKNCIITTFKCEIKNNNLQVANTDINNLKSKMQNYVSSNRD